MQFAVHTSVPQAEKARANKKLARRGAEGGAVRHNMHLAPKHTFDTFLAGENSNFACAAAQAVAKAPGGLYNPLLVYGGVGLGKTHLLHAIGQQVMANEKRARVVLSPSESFINEYNDSIQNKQLARFRATYRQADVLLVDDIQFLGGTERVQEEFYHTFNALYERQKQIVLTSDRPAGEIKNLEPRLLSRFESGLVTKLQPPDYETRLGILHKKAQTMGAELPEEIMEFLAQRIRSNIRGLEGALIRVVSYQVLVGRKPSLDMMEGLVREILDQEGRHSIDIQMIQKTVAEHFNIPLAEMTSRRRPASAAFPREIAMYLSRKMTQSSLNAIGDAFGGRYHTTVLHACHLVKDRIEVDPRVRQVVGHLERQLMR